MARYQDAIQWIAENDDNEWLGDIYRETFDYDAHGPMMSVTSVLVRDIFDKTDEQVIADLYKALRKVDRNRLRRNQKPR